MVDAADSFAVTYILSDACLAAAKPLVSASVIGMTGYVGAFCGGGPSYRAVFPDVSVDGGTCATVGVLGTAVGVLGSLQAHLALHLLLGLEPSVLGPGDHLRCPGGLRSAASALPAVPSPSSSCPSSRPLR